MSVEVLMPALSPTMEEGTLAKWLVKVGDEVKSGDVIAEIETDKATMEVEAVDEGVVEALLVPEGAEEVKVNTPIARLSGEGEAAAPTRSASEATPHSESPTTERPQSKSEPAEKPQAAAKPESKPAAKTAEPPSPAPGQDGADKGERLFASPLAKRLARQLGLELSKIAGSGPHGRIIRRDVEAAAGSAGRPAKPPEKTPETPSRGLAEPPARAPTLASLEAQGIRPGSYDVVALDGMRKTVAKRMTASFRDVPHFPLQIEVEIDALLTARARINALLSDEKSRVSVNDLLIKACAVALMRVPNANASFTSEGIARHHDADIAVAVAVEGGLITPIVRAAQSKGLTAISAEMKDLAERARSRKLKPEEYLGGTFSISNLGMYGVRSFASILNEPHGAILSVGAGEKRPVVRGDQVAVATVMSLTLTCDHRVVDGVIGAKFLAALKALIGDPIAMIL
ncbi:MAG: pyruvate dehydrogenase complex dihydrolipoamide acetyltransferase [Caulobacteraceae bacterium]